LTIQLFAWSVWVFEEGQSMQEWQATRARAALSAIIDAAVDGMPQLIRRRDGKAVVVVSKDLFDRTAPNLRDYLLGAGTAPEHDEFDDALRRVRESGGAFPRPRPVDFGN